MIVQFYRVVSKEYLYSLTVTLNSKPNDINLYTVYEEALGTWRKRPLIIEVCTCMFAANLYIYQLKVRVCTTHGIWNKHHTFDFKLQLKGCI